MQFHHQIYKHSPENGVYGDCFRTCLACLLDLKPGQVPHFFQLDHTAEQEVIDRAYAQVQEWLAGRGLVLFTIAYSGELQGIFDTMKAQNPGVYYLLAGSSGNANHQTIALEDKIIHDPNPEKPGLVGPSSDGYYWVNLLLPMNIHNVNPF